MAGRGIPQRAHVTAPAGFPLPQNPQRTERTFPCSLVSADIFSAPAGRNTVAPTPQARGRHVPAPRLRDRRCKGRYTSYG